MKAPVRFPAKAPQREKEPPGTAVKCRWCGQLVVWAQTAKGKRMPLDVSPNREGTFFLFRLPNRIDAVHIHSTDYRVARALDRGDQFYTSHFATCPMAAANRDKREGAPK